MSFVICVCVQLVSQKKQTIGQQCAACGHVAQVDMRHKLTTFIVKNPPEQVQCNTSALHLKERIQQCWCFIIESMNDVLMMRMFMVWQDPAAVGPTANKNERQKQREKKDEKKGKKNGEGGEAKDEPDSPPAVSNNVIN